MQAQPRRDTGPEVSLRSALHRQGFRFRVDAQVVPSLRRRADLVFPRAHIAVFVDGCFWHGCEEHIYWPKTNAQWWRNKIEATMERDRGTNLILQAEGWTVVRVWEHECVDVSSQRIARLIRETSASSLQSRSTV
jgi:DNA mismatch endonuclease (patch repair protein)